MIRLCLDTSGYSRLLRGDSNLRQRLEEADEVLFPMAVLGELNAGFFMGSRERENRAELVEFLSLPGVRSVPVTENIAERYGLIVKQLREEGNPIPTNDIWIAATVLETGSRLVAYDNHFTRVPGLMVESP